MLRGFYDTFRRRLTQIVEQGGSVKREWILAVDVNKSPMLHGKGGHHLRSTRQQQTAPPRAFGR